MNTQPNALTPHEEKVREWLVKIKRIRRKNKTNYFCFSVPDVANSYERALHNWHLFKAEPQRWVFVTLAVCAGDHSCALQHIASR